MTELTERDAAHWALDMMLENERKIFVKDISYYDFTKEGCFCLIDSITEDGVFIDTDCCIVWSEVSNTTKPRFGNGRRGRDEKINFIILVFISSRLRATSMLADPKLCLWHRQSQLYALLQPRKQRSVYKRIRTMLGKRFF